MSATAASVSWLLETVQSRQRRLQAHRRPVGGDTGYDSAGLHRQAADRQRSASVVYQSLRFKLGYTDQDLERNLPRADRRRFHARPEPALRGVGERLFCSEHEQYQASYVIDPGNSWRGKSRPTATTSGATGTSCSRSAAPASAACWRPRHVCHRAWLPEGHTARTMRSRFGPTTAAITRRVCRQARMGLGFGDTEVA